MNFYLRRKRSKSDLAVIRCHTDKVTKVRRSLETANLFAKNRKRVYSGCCVFWLAIPREIKRKCTFIRRASRRFRLFAILSVAHSRIRERYIPREHEIFICKNVSGSHCVFSSSIFLFVRKIQQFIIIAAKNPDLFFHNERIYRKHVLTKNLSIFLT